MERYPVEVTSVLAPLVIVQGLGVDGVPEGTVRPTKNGMLKKGSQFNDKSIQLPHIDDLANPWHSLLYDEDCSPDIIKRESPVVHAASGLELVSLLNNHNIGDNYWLKDNNKEYSKQFNYNIKFVGNQYRLPKPSTKSGSLSRKSSGIINTPPPVTTSTLTTVDTITDPLTDSPIPASTLSSKVSNADSGNSYDPSPLSTLDPNSKYYQTILPLEWIQKYRDIVPFVFISVHELDGDIEDASECMAADKKLADEIIKLKEQVTKRGIKFLSLILCSRSTALRPELDERVNALRKATILPSRTGMLFLQAGTQRELETFALSIIHLIKPWSIEYYSAQEKKLQRKKSQVLNPNYKEKFWLARQALKNAVFLEMKGINEYSTKSLEYAYEKLVDAVRLIDTEKEEKLWEQSRLLLDFTGIHITRSYLILGDSNQAYKKFDIHIQNVLSILPKTIIRSYSVISWLSLQLTWLAQLIELVPENIIPIDRSLQPFTNSKWFGTNTLEVSGLSMPQGGYLYLQACSLMRRRKIQAKESANDDADTPKLFDSYMALPIEDELKFDYTDACIKLLSGALEFFSRAKRSKFSRSESYIYFQLGEENFSIKNYGMAVNNYLVALTIFKNENWNGIVAIILFRLFNCSLKLKQEKDAQMYYLQMCTLDQRHVKPFMKLVQADVTNISTKATSADESLSSQSSDSDLGELILKDNLFECSSVFKDLPYSLTDTVYFQVTLKPTANNLLQDLKMSEIHIQFSNKFRGIKVIHNESLPLNESGLIKFVDTQKGKDELLFEANLTLLKDKQPIIINFELNPNRIGRFKIQSIRLKLSSNNIFFANHVSPSIVSGNKLKWFKPYSSLKYGNSLAYDIVTGKQLEFEITPKQPKIEVNIEHTKYVYNGQIVPITIKCINKDLDRYGLQFAATATISGKQLLKFKWDKEVEYSSTYHSPDILESGDGTTSNVLFMYLPLIEDLTSDVVKVELNLKYLIDNNEDATVENIKSLEIPILSLFKLNFSIFPMTNSVIPSIFDLSETDASGSIPTLPVHNRSWLGKSSIKNLAEEGLKISDIKLQIVTVSANSVTDLIEPENPYPTLEIDSNSEDSIKFNFLSYCLDNHLKKSINIEINISFYYEFLNQDLLIINKFEASLWKGALPHMDPRSLVNLTKLSDTLLEVEYIVENPTSRIFQFSSTLSPAEAFQILNFKNQYNFSILPFMKQFIKFRYQLVDSVQIGDVVKLPEFKIYDLNYKVYLNSLVGCDLIRGGKNGLYYVHE
ncbi:hypothetical protein CANARDRAFT_26129 [[Candida] arabinofermentans NRRL YB-2248]|uniref:Trafficking protein particle complex subunit 11 domain-containing protein n=1 Tax=[Candida] arabinofermentans NRRL YB-2248 TaxID=983967 RepID=A0A1E4T871_9ASCO|nr:hypothetical protein CANARDRAFT_26129 [[Candida] arabinofermentans NRRL YB-2248]